MSRLSIPLAFRHQARFARTTAATAPIPATETTRDAIIVDLFNLLVQLSCVLDEQTTALAASRDRIDVLESLAGVRAVDREKRHQAKMNEQIRIPVELEAGL